ncbi:MAG: GtrA family protein [Clostridia bacterium]|nr:GtrA family protein [Clostridia bacterium]
MIEKLQGVVSKLENGRFAPLVQFIKFGLVGVSNTAISYGIDMLGYYVLFKNSEFPGLVTILNKLGIPTNGNQVKVVIVTAIAFIVSVANSYFWNNRYVFAAEEKRTVKQHAIAFLRMMTCYAMTGLILSPFLKIILNNTGIPYWLASLGSMMVVIPLNYFLNKYWAFGKK